MIKGGEKHFNFLQFLHCCASWSKIPRWNYCLVVKRFTLFTSKLSQEILWYNQNAATTFHFVISTLDQPTFIWMLYTKFAHVYTEAHTRDIFLEKLKFPGQHGTLFETGGRGRGGRTAKHQNSIVNRIWFEWLKWLTDWQTKEKRQRAITRQDQQRRKDHTNKWMNEW